MFPEPGFGYKDDSYYRKPWESYLGYESIDEYLQAHPDIDRKVNNRLSRVPDKARGGLLTRIMNPL